MDAELQRNKSQLTLMINVIMMTLMFFCEFPLLKMFPKVPLTVAELARSTYAVPTTVEELVSSNPNLVSSTNLLLTTANNGNNKEATTPLTISTTNTTDNPSSKNDSSSSTENRSSGSLESLARSMNLEPVLTSLPPLPRTLPPNMPKKSNSGILREEEIIAFMDPVSCQLLFFSP